MSFVVIEGKKECIDFIYREAYQSKIEPLGAFFALEDGYSFLTECPFVQWVFISETLLMDNEDLYQDFFALASKRGIHLALLLDGVEDVHFYEKMGIFDRIYVKSNSMDIDWSFFEQEKASERVEGRKFRIWGRKKENVDEKENCSV